MINVTDETKSAYTTDSVDKQVTITFPNRNIVYTNTDIISESLEITEVIETERHLTFQGCIASRAKFKLANLITDLRDEYVEITIQAENTETIPLFRGYVDSQDNLTHQDTQTQITCYDPLYTIGSRNMQSWVDSLTFPRTIKQLRDSLFTALGIEQESKTLINDQLSVSDNFKTFCDNPSAVQIMKWICQVNAVFGQYGRDGKFHYREILPITEGLYPGEDTYPSEETYPAAENVGTILSSNEVINIDYQPYETDMITKVVIYDAGGLDVAQSGSGTNVFGISDNPIAFSVNMQRAVDAIFATLSSVTYIPIKSMECPGMPYLECGDTYLCYTRRFTVRSYILQRTLKGIQALRDNFESDSDKEYPAHKVTATTRINADRKSIIDIQADIVNFKEVTARSIQAVDAKFNNLNASNITSGTLDANRINVTNLNASNITGGTLNVDRIQASSITASKLNVSASGDNWSVGFSGGNSWFYTGALGAEKVTGSISGGRNWGINFGGYGAGGTFSIGTLDASSITTGTLSADRIDVNKIASKFSSSTNITCGTLNARTASGAILEYTTIKANYAAILFGYQSAWKTLNVRLGNGNTKTIHYLGWTSD